MTKLSAVIITFNEELNIARCIKSLADLADEIVIVDSYSKDKTKEILKENASQTSWNKLSMKIIT